MKLPNQNKTTEFRYNSPLNFYVRTDNGAEYVVIDGIASNNWLDNTWEQSIGQAERHVILYLAMAEKLMKWVQVAKDPSKRAVYITPQT